VSTELDLWAGATHERVLEMIDGTRATCPRCGRYVQQLGVGLLRLHHVARDKRSLYCAFGDDA
jgi:hypothetical protein